MRWKVEPGPKFGEIRQRRPFAWKKTRIEDYWVWLEFYGVEEEFRHPLNGPAQWLFRRKYTLDYYC